MNIVYKYQISKIKMQNDILKIKYLNFDLSF